MEPRIDVPASIRAYHTVHDDDDRLSPYVILRNAATHRRSAKIWNPADVSGESTGHDQKQPKGVYLTEGGGTALEEMVVGSINTHGDRRT